ncbi:uncharacterized protein V1518DRAFT_422137 [Limtongia smithiae]|uniref:uncharacterized protein n=1 Tax=Limtongia smithiae TaxID=1125753 RepID=UPI0034CD88C1
MCEQTRNARVRRDASCTKVAILSRLLPPVPPCTMKSSRPGSWPSAARYSSQGSSQRTGSRFGSSTGRDSFRGGNSKFNSSNSRGGPSHANRPLVSTQNLPAEATSARESYDARLLGSEVDRAMGFDLYEEGPARVGWLINMHSSIVQESEGEDGVAAVNFYFLGEDGENFKASYKYDPYFLIGCKAGYELEIEEYLLRKYEGLVKKTARVIKEDLDMPNHLVGYKRTYIKIIFANVTNLLSVRREIMPLAEKNRKMLDALDVYAETISAGIGMDDEYGKGRASKEVDVTECIVDVREYDVPYHVRVSIDSNIRIGKWYTVSALQGDITITEMPERLTRPDPIVLAFDIETTKLPLKFPDVLIDKIMMISYMIDGKGFLITNREIVSQDIDDFEYTPKPEYEGVFTIFNETDEKAVIQRFFEHIKDTKPTVIVTYNGDFFDWPFVEGRAKYHGIDMYSEIGFHRDSEDEYKSSYCCHMDAFRWVKRDSYLPQGSQGLKAVTTAKMGYDPIELDPELMTKYAAEKPQTLSEYSVSDAVATYYLYMKYVHPFIFSLCNIIPLNPDEVLRKGTGTLCEMLLMVQAYERQIILPNKHKEAEEQFYDGHLIESETYVGGHVESLEAGVFRSDIPVDFSIDTTAVDQLLDQLDSALKFCIEIESNMKLSDVTNYDEVKQKIAAQLRQLREEPKRTECPSIYHLDVSSMYPNIMITNRLQPDSMIQEADCAACDFNHPGKGCDRRLPWMWRGEFFPAKKDEYNMIKRALQGEMFPGRFPGQPQRSFQDLPMSEQTALIKKRLSDYSRKIYHKIKETKTIEKEAIICQRENPFYANTVRDFRDRRYEYKNKHKVWKKNLEAVAKDDPTGREEAKKMIILYDSLQLAHKCILNSFYGYVMRKGSRWYSMEMAGVTCLTGATIIQMARALVERIGRPLELDTDGIWCIIPQTFPENFTFTLQDGKKLFISYPCVMLNHLVHDRFTNDQYQTLIDPATFKYDVKSENSIFFEVDGPYRAMILPTSKEEGKNLKKRYAVFNNDGTLAELKGFEVKRRGELRLIKIFQTQIFKVFLEGGTLEECYGRVARVSNQWLDVLDSRGDTLADDELIDLICENRSMTRTLEDYGTQKSTSISTAKRLAEFLGNQMVKDKGLACKYIISEQPRSAPVTERAIPVAIFSADESVKSHFLRRWLKDPGITEFDPRDIIDWSYYRERLASVIQKIITIPAALQKVANPVPRVRHPDWLLKRLARQENGRQVQLDSFKTKPMSDVTNVRLGDLEDLASGSNSAGPPKGRPVVARVTSKRKLGDKSADVAEALFASLPLVMPNVNEDYEGWIGYMKQKWKIQRQARQRRQHLFGTSVSHRTNPGDVLGYFKSRAESTYSKEWQILQFSETEVPGELKCWAIIAGQLQGVKIKVPRRIYLDFKNTDFPEIAVSGITVERANSTLPSGKSSNLLFRITMPEALYVEQKHKAISILNHPSIDGVYESGVDPVTRAVLEMGNRCQVDMTEQGVLGRGMESGFDMKSLQKSMSTVPYMHGVKMKIVYLYHATAGERQIFMLFASFKDEANTYIYEATTRQQQQFPNMDNVYREQYLQMREKKLIVDDTFAVQEQLTFQIDQTSNLKRVKRAMNAQISKLFSESNSQAVLVLTSPSPQRMAKDLSAMREMPVLHFAPSSSDMVLPSIGWQLPLARRMVLHYMGISGRVSQLFTMAQYSNIPLGNLKGEDARFVIDVQYARKLQEANVILWWSSMPFADNGGREKDMSLLTTENLTMPVVNNANLYENVCIELSVQNLAINTVLTSALINEMEGTDVATGPENGGISFMENASSTAAVAVLRSLVKQWWEEARSQNKNADMVVNSFVRWVSSAESYLYDPVLQYHVRNLSRKAFLQLIAEFRRVGSQVVYAEQDRVVVQTSKQSVSNARAYAQYIVKAIRAKPLFSFLDIEITRYWDMLVWMDEVNYGGYVSNDADISTQEMHWQLQSFLPEMLQHEFGVWVAEFLENLHGAKRAQQDADATRTPRATQLRSERDQHSYFGKGAVSKMRKQLHRRVQQLHRRQAESAGSAAAAAEFAIPVRPGSHLNTTNATAEFAKSLCAVFALARDLQLEVGLLRKELLSVFDIREFSEAGKFRNPSTSLRVSAICDACSIESTLDFCRNEALIPAISAEIVGGSDVKAWECKHCGHEFDRLGLEETMIAEVQTLETVYQTQDLRCGKCKQIRADNLSEHCGCSGPWEQTVTAEEVRSRFAVYGSVAGYYGLEMLRECMQRVGVV